MFSPPECILVGGGGGPLHVCTCHSFKWLCSIPLFKCTIINVTSLLRMDIWAVSSLQWPEEGAEDVYLEFQGASWTHLLGCVRFLAGTWIVFPQRLRSGRLEDVISRVWLIWASARWPEHCLLFEKRLPCRGKLRTCSWQPTAEVPDKTVSNSRAVGQSSTSQQRWKVAALPGSTENPALVSWPGTLQLRLGLVLTPAHKDGCKTSEAHWGILFTSHV